MLPQDTETPTTFKKKTKYIYLFLQTRLSINGSVFGTNSQTAKFNIVIFTAEMHCSIDASTTDF